MPNRQAEAKSCAANHAELSRAKPEHFASVWPFCIWGSVAWKTVEMVLKKGQSGRLEKPPSLEVACSSWLASTCTQSHGLSWLLKMSPMVTHILNWNSTRVLEFIAHDLQLKLLQEHYKARNKHFSLRGTFPSANTMQAKM